jgi:short-chain fatty acids transporter
MANWSEKWVPNPFLFAVLLTIIAYIAANVATPDGPVENVQNWYGGFWTLLTFAMQMVPILVTGYAVADSDPVSSYLDRLASWPDTNAQAAATTGVVGMADVDPDSPAHLVRYAGLGACLVVGVALSS